MNLRAKISAFSILLFCSSIATAQTGTESVVYSFASDSQTKAIQASDGGIYVLDTLGGTGYLGGIVRIGLDGSKTIAHSFTGTDGSRPTAMIQGSDGNLYGVTGAGGAYTANCTNTAQGCPGNIFQYKPSNNSLNVLYNFCSTAGCPDGEQPNSIMQGYDGNLYITTATGGTLGNGVLGEFNLSTSTYTLLHTFASTEGAQPAALVEAANGTFYGVATNGGTNVNHGSGTIFDYVGGNLNVLYTFCQISSCADGESPIGRLTIDSSGNLIGATFNGGVYPNTGGTIFSFNPNSLALTTLYSFNYCGSGSCASGQGPTDFTLGPPNTIDVTTAIGGTTGNGTLMALDLNSSTATILYSYCSKLNCSDGSDPSSILRASDGSFFGVTGDYNNSLSFPYYQVYNVVESPAAAAPVVVTISPSTITSGQTANLSWTTDNVFSGTPAACYAFGADPAWTGIQLANGNTTVSPTAAATYTYSLTCGGIQTGFATLVVSPTTTTTTLNATPTTLNAGSPITLTATVTPASGSTPTGTVTFYNGTTSLGTAPVNPSGVATLSPTLAVGSYSITASYGGSTSDSSSVSTPAIAATVSINATSTTLAASGTALTAGQSLTLTATVTPTTGGTPSGTVTFKNGTTTLGTASLNPSGVATYTFTPAAGLYSFTASYGGSATDATSATSPALAVSDALITTTTTLGSSASSVTPAQSVTLTATVHAVSGATPAGTVTFLNGATTLGTGVLNGSGVATYTFTPPVGTYSLTASYGGSTTDAISASTPAVALTSALASTTTTLTSSATTLIPGQSVTLTATVAAGVGGTPTGTVNFFNGTTQVGSGTLNGSGVTTLTLTPVAGTYSYTATYTGSTGDGSSTSTPAISVTDAAITTTTTLSSSLTQVTPAQTVTLTATVTPASGSTPTGTVTFNNGASSLGSGTLNASGVATLTITPTAGVYSITANYGGSTTDGSSTSSPAVTVTSTIAPTTTTLTASASSILPGQTVTLTATVAGPLTYGTTPTGNVTFYNGTTSVGSGALTNGVATLTLTPPLGTYSYTATYGGSNGDLTSTSSPAVALNVALAATTTALTSSATSLLPGQSLTLTATVASGNGTPSGNVTFYSGTNTLGTSSVNNSGVATLTLTPSVGVYSITATYAGSTSYAPSASTPAIGVTVALSPTTTTLTSSATTLTPNQNITLTATVAASIGATPTGSVTFYNGGNVLGTGNLSNGIATLTTPLAAGVYSITATYTGSTSDNVSSSSPAIGVTVALINTTTTLATSATSLTPYQTLTLTATVAAASGSTPTGSVTFYNGTSSLGVSALTNGVATLTLSPAAGVYTITAAYTGSTSNTSSTTSSASTVTVAYIPTTTTLTSSATTQTPNQTITFTATVAAQSGGTPTGSVTFYNGGTTLGAATVNSNGVATLTLTLSVGTYSITATYGGSTTDATSTSTPAIGVTVTLIPTTTTLTPSATNITPGQTLTLTATVAASTGSTPTGTVTFYNGTTMLGTGALNNGVATYSLTTALGSYSYTASYGGSSTDATSTSTAAAVTVAYTSTATVLSASPLTLTPGQTLNLTATVTEGNGATPTGSVSFYNGTTLLGTGILNASGVATLALTPSNGTYSLTAGYAATSTTTASTSAPAIAVTVAQSNTSIALTASSSSLSYGQPLTLTATVAASYGNTPTGTVNFYNGTTLIGTGILNTNGVATLTLTPGIGTYSYSATFAGSTADLTSTTTTTVSVGIVKVTTATALTTSASTLVPGQTVTLTATVTSSSTDTPTGTVSFYNGATLLGTSSLSTSGIASLTLTPTLGSYTYTATYGGSTTDLASTSSVAFLTVSQATTTTTLAASSSTLVPGQSLTLTATVAAVAGNTPTGSVSFYSGTTLVGTAVLNSGIATLNLTPVVGSYNYTATYTGSTTDLSSSSSSVPVVVALAPTTTLLTTSSSTLIPGQTLTLTATVSATLGSTPTGTVTFYINGSTLGTGTLNNLGIATYTTTPPTGTYNYTASYGGSTSDMSSASTPASVTIAQATTTTVLTPSSVALIPGQTLTLTAAVTANAGNIPTGTVSFYNGTTLLGTGTLNIYGVATLTLTPTLGSYNYIALYNGSTADQTSSSSPVAVLVALASTTTTLTPSATALTPGQSLTLTASVTAAAGATPTGTVNFYSGSTLIGGGVLNSNGVVTLSVTPATGTFSYTATYGGSSVDAASTSTTAVTVSVAQAPTTTTLTPSNTNLYYGQTLTLTATVAAAYGNTPTGLVNFYNGSNILGSGILNSSGVASITLSPGVGILSLTATYSGSITDLTSTSTPVYTATISPAQTSTGLVASATTLTPGQSLTLTATVAAATGSTPTGTVTFYNGSNVMGTATLNTNGIATYTLTPALGNYSYAANYNGSTNDAGSVSAPVVTVNVSQAITSTTITASASTLIPGQTLTLTATVAAVNGLTPTGTVTFYNGSTAIGTGTLNVAGVATLTLTPALGTFSYSANYTGSTADLPSTTATAVTVTVAYATTTTTLTPSASSLYPGQTLTLTAVVTAASGSTPGGIISFYNGSTLLGTNTLNSNGIATFTVTSVLGTYSFTASYGGSSIDASSVSSPAVLVSVTQATTTTSLTASSSSLAPGQSLTLTASVASASGNTPTGTVTFYNGSAVLGSASLSGNGIATLVLTPTSGNYSISASYGGSNADLASASSPALIIVVAQVSTTTSLMASSSSLLTGQSLTLTATVIATNNVTPTGTVTFFNGSNSLGSAALSNTGVATLTITPVAGIYSIGASYGGSIADLASTSALTVAVTVAQATTTTTMTASASTLTVGQSLTLTATVSASIGGTPTGSVTFYNGSTPLGSAPVNSNGLAALTITPAAASYLITASYGGSTADAASSSSPAIPVAVSPAQIATTTIISASTNSLTVGQTLTLTATVTPVSGSIPTGTITFYNGALTLGSATLNGNGAAAIVLTPAVGIYSITASYSGSTLNTASQSATPVTVTVTPVSTTTILNASAASLVPGQVLTLTATVVTSNSTIPAGTITFYNGTSAVGSGILNGSGSATISLTPSAGIYNFTAVYGGSTAFTASSSAPALTVTVAIPSVATTTTLSIVTNPAYFGVPLTVTAIVTSNGGTPTGIVTFYDGATALGTSNLNSSGVATFNTTGLNSGINNVSAVYAGASGFFSSNSNIVVETVKANFSLTASPSAQSVYAGAAALYTINVTPGNGFTLPVTLSCSGLPTGTTCDFSPTALTSGNSLMTIQTASPAAHSVAASSMLATGSRIALMIGVAMLLFTWKLRRNFSRGWKMLMMLVLLTTVGLVTGCGSNPVLTGGTTVGKYTVTVTGTAITGAQIDTLSTNVTLTVNSLY